ncbi:HAD-IIB family hydrolase [Pseudoclavibacter sp. CFCC 13796]|uniref:HAD-IIB family hydrolase n=1 Tax=Pseudoclavibacter sp. CFCC 13796 TaxID=2615179 RepID=UPI001301195B|nr:HAD-IIB family hydrolase [Pseudoclavibacter sp. CFCC 13796]KAB1660474.1 HAD-IIB family hydrolase [Pseudoclavibacter sp. CFCC 13796]
MPDLPKLVAFDLDDTLAPSKSRVPESMAQVLRRLLDRTQVCVISGGNIGQFQAQVIDALEAAGGTDDELDRLHLMPTCGTRYHRHAGGAWHEVYAQDLSADEKAEAERALTEQAKRLGLWESKTWGPIIEDRGSQITFSALGQQAPVEAKQAWDPTGERKDGLRRAVQAVLPDLEVRAGGTTSIDITRRGIDKAYGIRQLAEQTGIGLDEMLFFGDKLHEDGNDYPVRALGVESVEVTGWPDTEQRLRHLLGL